MSVMNEEPPSDISRDALNIGLPMTAQNMLRAETSLSKKRNFGHDSPYSGKTEWIEGWLN